MRRGAFKLAAVLVVGALLTAGLAACGGSSDDSTTSKSSTSTTTSSSTTNPAKPHPGGSAAQAQPNRSSGNEAAGKPAAGAPPSSRASFSDSGGGSTQFREAGGDNSIQEFGDEGDESDREEAATVLWGYLGARADGDWPKACSYLSAPSLEMLEKLASNSENLKGKDCPAVLSVFLGELPPGSEAEWTTADVGSLRTEDDRGFILYHGANGTAYFMQLLNEDDTWKIAGLAPVPFP